MSEGNANFIGKDGFNWFVGQVENDGSGHFLSDLAKNVAGSAVNIATRTNPLLAALAGKTNFDWDWTNKVKVRIMGYHSPSKIDLPTEDLPWALVMMPVTSPQRSGIGSVHQLQINSWVIGFFMDGENAQVPIILGALGDENPQGGYGSLGGTSVGFDQLSAPAYNEKKHGGEGSSVGGTGSTVQDNEETGQEEAPKNNDGIPDEEGKDDTKNPRGPAEGQTQSQQAANKKKCVTVQVGNGKCGGETATKLEAPMAEFMKFARGIEQNAIGDFIDKQTGDIVDLEQKITSTTNRIQAKLNGLLGNIKGVVMEDVNKLVQEGLDEISIPNPDLENEVKTQLKDVGGLVSCLFKDMIEDLKDFIKGMLEDLLENVLDTALCLIENMIGDIMGKIMEKIDGALSVLKGVTGSIKGAADKIQGLLSKVGEFLDLFCDGAVSCAIGASVFETCHGAKAKGNDAKAKEVEQYPVKPPAAGEVIGDGKPINGFVPFVKDGIKQVFDTKSGALTALSSAAGIASGITALNFDTRGPLQKFEGLNFYGSDGKIASSAVNCNNSILNKKPCFPEMVWDNLQSTTPVKALPIIDDIGTIVGVFMRNKGSRVNLEAKVRAQFTCNEPEGGGATFKPNIIDGGLETGNIVDSITVTSGGIGYGFDPADTFCPKEQYAALVPKAGLVQYLKDGDILMLSKTAAGVEDPTTPDLLNVVDVDHDDDHILIATIDPKYNAQFEIGMELMTKSKHKFILNFQNKFPDLIVPGQAKAVYANCGDMIPVIETIKPINVGANYVNPIITIGNGEKEQQIGTFSTDKDGRLVEPTITNKVLGFVKPKIRDVGTTDTPGRGSGAEIAPTYTFTGPRKIKETGILQRQTYIDCVGHPMLNGS
tara:strand:+ start:9851 stop:12484 length:2634 start_codon:yes stop_codon:yes gene_type:complete